MYCWGNTSNGELGLGGVEDQHIFTPVEAQFEDISNIKKISCGKFHTLLLTKNGKVYSCGNNDYGQLGHNELRTRFQLVQNLESFSMTDIVASESHSVGLNEWGQVYTWGSNSHGQLGFPTPEAQYISRPQLVRRLATCHVIQISCGYRHCLALTNNGDLYSWGCNEFGQLGLGVKIKTFNEPTHVSSLNGLPIAFITCGSCHSFVLSKSGAVYGWGKNNFGQLGLNSVVDNIFPSHLRTLRSIRVKYISCGEDFSAFLTQDGGVLTCGAGQNGQLGHGSNSNEILPRKVMELMGSTVIQISTGRRHCLVFIPSRRKVYAFGLGGLGQLGTKQWVSCNSPQMVLGPWNNADSNLTIDRIFAGGDQCFVTMSPNGVSRDYRQYEIETQIWTVTRDVMRICADTDSEKPVNQDLLTYLETVFSSECCINGSFLNQDELEYNCTSKYHGVDLDLAFDSFDLLSKTQNTSILSLVMQCVFRVVENLATSPPDVETLRVYLILPLYHEFINSKHSAFLQGPFANSILQLKTGAANVVANWYYLMRAEYFERLITIYKSVVAQLLRNTPGKELKFQLRQCGPTMIKALEVLSFLNLVNKLKTNTIKVPYETFYFSDIQDYVDIRFDYIRWVVEGSNDKAGKPCLCHYPFLFDAEAKTLLLQTDQSLQMQSAMNQATHQALLRPFFSGMPAGVTPLLEIHVTRENLVQDTLRELSNYPNKDFKKPLKVHIIGEEAVDAGGVKKEFFMLLLREILDPKYGMFVSDSESNAIWFSELSFEDEVMYYLVGLICGLAIYNFTIISLPFPLALYKKLLNEPVQLEDLLSLSPSLARGLQSLLDYEGDDIEDVFCLKFEVTRDVFGEIRTTPLKPNGSEISVTNSNKKDYVDLYVDFVLNTSIDVHFRAFKDAFLNVCGSNVIKLFQPHELMAVIIGNENYNWEVFENVAEYAGGYTSSHHTIRLFWEVFHELSFEDKKKFLVFLTGTDRIPIEGMKAVKILIQPTKDEKFLPVAHTCFNLLDLPEYQTKERLRYKLLQAIQQTEGFSLV